MIKSKYILLIIIGICALIFATMLLLHVLLPGFLSDKVEEEISSGLNPDAIELYEVEAGTFSFSAFFRTTSLSELKIKPREIELNKQGENLLPKQIFETAVNDLKISSWTLITLAMGWKKIKVNQFCADSIFLAIYTNESGKTNVDSAKSRNMEHLNLENISTNKLRFEKRSLADTSWQALQTGKIEFKGEISFFGEEDDQYLKPGIQAHSLKILGARGSSSNGLYNYHVDSVSYNGNEQTADLNGLKMMSRYSKQEFHKHVQFETDRFDARLNHIKISGIQTDRAIQDGSMVLSQIEINGGRLEVFRDRKPPFNEKQRPVMPVRLIQDAPFGLFADKIQFKKFDIIYAELPEDSNTAGEIPFRQLSATIYNVSNLKDSLASDSIMKIRAEALIFGKAKLQAEFQYNLTDPSGTYEAKGELAKLSFEDLNPAVYPLTGLRIIDGMHQHTSFFFYGNDARSIGELRMQYSGLLIQVLPENDSNLLKHTARFLGKEFLYYQANPADYEDLRVGKIEFDRDIKRFVFNYWWKSFLSGTIDSILEEPFSG